MIVTSRRVMVVEQPELCRVRGGEVEMAGPAVRLSVYSSIAATPVVTVLCCEFSAARGYAQCLSSVHTGACCELVRCRHPINIV